MDNSQHLANGHILLIEDNPDDVALTLRALKKSNIANDVLVATDGAQALDLLFASDQASRKLPVLILLDLKLPKVDGFEVLQRIRTDQFTRLIPTVILTSSTEQEDVLNGYSLGANAYVRKPVEFADFADAVHTLGMFWLLLNQPAPPLGAPPS